MFIPVQRPTFVKKHNSKESWLEFEIEEFLANKHTYNKLPNIFEIDPTYTNKNVIRCRRRFEWNSREESKSINGLINYHKKMRKYLFYITSSHGPSWYLKRNSSANRAI